MAEVIEDINEKVTKEETPAVDAEKQISDDESGEGPTKSAVDEPMIESEEAETDPPMREFSFNMGSTMGTLRFNPVTSFIGMAILWGLSAWCMADPDGALETLLDARGGTALRFTWLYVGTRPLFTFFILYIAYKYGDVRFGAPDSKPEFSNMSYFAMLFSAGVAVGLFFYGVSEPLWHRESHWYANQEFRSQDEKDQMAMNYTLYHWGLSAWSGYVLVALAVGLAAYRFKMPMTLRSTMYPILGKYTWGWMGDCIDGFTIVVTVAGVCTSLGLGAMQIMAGMQRVGWLDLELTESERNNGLVAIIWVITIFATASVVSGLEVGIKHLSNLAFYLGQTLLFWIFAMENSAYILNMFVQSSGYYLQNSVLLMAFWTDAFGQLREGEGRATDGEAAAVWFMDAWTIFYMAWWTAWSGFVGIFIARISKGRSIFEVTLFGTLVPMVYITIWFCVFGGVGIRQARQAEELEVLGTSAFGNADYFLADGSSYCYDVPQQDVLDVNSTVIFTNYLKGITPVCKFNTGDPDNAWFNVMFSFTFPEDFSTGFGYVFSIFSIFSVGLYFVTSSDSGSLIVDHLASNGREKHHWLQRVFWAFTEGAVASALLIAGGRDALRALQAASIIAGLPFTILMVYMIQSILIMCEKAHEDPNSQLLDLGDKPHFKTPSYGGIFNIMEYVLSAGSPNKRCVELGIHAPKSHHVSGFFMYLFLPFLGLKKFLDVEYPRSPKSNIAFLSLYTFTFIGMIILFSMQSISHAMEVFGWSCFLGTGLMLGSTKMEFRARHNIHGNVVGDFTSAFFLWPQVLVQLNEMAGELNSDDSHHA